MNELTELIREALGTIPAEITENRNAGGLLRDGAAVFVAEEDAEQALKQLKAFRIRFTWHSGTCIIVSGKV